MKNLNFLFREKPALVLLALQNLKEHERYSQNLVRICDTPFCHMYQIVKELRRIDFIYIEQQKGRKKFIRLTEKGLIASKNILSIKNILE